MSGSIASSIPNGVPSLASGWVWTQPSIQSMMASTPASYWQQPGQPRVAEPARPTLQSDLSAHIGGIVIGLLVQALIAVSDIPPQVPGVRVEFWPEYAAVAVIAATVMAFAFGRTPFMSLPLGVAVFLGLTFLTLPFVAWTFASMVEVRSAGGLASDSGLGTLIAHLFFGSAFFGLSGMLFAWNRPTPEPLA